MDAGLLLSPVPFADALAFLERSRRPTLELARAGLEGARQVTRAARILSALDPGLLARTGAYPVEPYPNDELHPVINETLGAINQVAPLDLEHMEISFETGELLDEMWPVPLGYPCGWDDWTDMAGDLDATTDEMGLYIFYTCLRLDDLETLAAASERFDWDLPEPALPEYDHLDWTRHYELLEREGFGEFRDAVDIIFYQTGNPYFDFNPFDETEGFDLPPFTLEGVRSLQAAFQEALPKQQNAHAARDRFTADPEIARQLLSIWRRCLVRSPRGVPPGRTLVDVLGVPTPEERTITDPFYGPIGVIDDLEAEVADLEAQANRLADELRVRLRV